ncbi:MAG: TIGR03943 family protein [Acidimicrobiales bacterium]
MLSVGAIMARLLWSGGFGWFVQQRMRLPLVAAAVVLLVFGAYEAIAGTRDEQRDPESVRRPAGPVVGWLLIAPLLVLISVAPTGLGAAAAGRVDAYTPTERSTGFAPLDPLAGPVQLRVFDFLERALWDESRSLEGVPVRLEGLVVNDPEISDGFKLTRFMVSCCAADGIPLQVVVHDPGPGLPDDTWVIAEVVWRPPATPYQDTSTHWIVEADAVSVTVVPDAPTDPYESPY